ncbi:MAG: histidine--tRNA ligase [Candidatus Kerfeldbacteria bacterium]|nr:histidine--tRNA ligase [Candidatus Kerfeldbacteria bacterium]
MTAPVPINKKKEQKASAPVNLLSGFKDRLPADVPYWEQIIDLIRSLARDYSFFQIETPVIEDARLFSILNENDGSDGDTLITFPLGDGPAVALRPENTLPLARAYREHGFASLPQPVKIFTLGPQFRAERPGAGRLRQFTQFGLEVFGDASPIVDAQIIAAVHFFFQDLGLDVRLHLNSIGHPACRAQYEKLLADFYRTRRSVLCDDCKQKLAKNPMRLLVCQVPECQEVAQEAPQIIDHLCDPDRQHFVQVLEHLDEVDVSYVLDSRLLRDKPYYNRTVVEFFVTLNDGRTTAIAGGGRFDDLVTAIGGEPTPAFGVAAGVERIILAMKEQGIQPPASPAPDVFLAQIGDDARKKSLRLFLDLRHDGIKVAESLSKEGIKAQLETATRVRARFALILGQKEIMDGTILLRDMENGMQEVVDVQKIIPEVKKRLQSARVNGSSRPSQPPVIPASPTVTRPNEP